MIAIILRAICATLLLSNMSPVSSLKEPGKLERAGADKLPLNKRLGKAQWIQSLPTYRKEMEHLLVTRSVVLLQAYGPETAALDRKTGKPLWSSPHTLIGAYGGTRDVVILAQEERIERSTIGSGEEEGPVHFDWRQRLMAVNATTGDALWQDSEPIFNVRAVGVYDGIIELVALVGRKEVRYRDALTGDMLDPGMPATAERLRRVAAHSPKTRVWSSLAESPAFQAAFEYQESFLPYIGLSFYKVENQFEIYDTKHFVEYTFMGNGHTGETPSSYVSFETTTGQERWKYPSIFYFREIFHWPPTRIPPVDSVKAESTINGYKVFSDLGLIVARDGLEKVHWLRAEDGKPPWKSVFGTQHIWDVAQVGNDLLVLTSPTPGHVQEDRKNMALWLVDGHSGTIKRKAPVASSDSLCVAGDSLYLFDGLNRGVVSAYTIHALFPSSDGK